MKNGKNGKNGKDGKIRRGLPEGQPKETALVSLGVFLEKHAALIAGIALVSIVSAGTVFAAATGSSADALWETIRDLIKTWVTRLGAVVMFVGAVMFGLGWKNDDAEGKSRGISTIIAGAIVTAAAAMTATFFA